MDAANREPDADTRGRLLEQAEKLALEDYAWLPARFPFTLDLVQPYVKGWVANIRDFNRTRWLSVDRPVVTQ